MIATEHVLIEVLRAEIEVAAHIIGCDARSLTTSDAVLALRAFGLRCSERGPLVEMQLSMPEVELQHVVAELCERYGAGLHKKPRQRVLTITAPREFIDVVLQPVIQGVLDVVIGARHEASRQLIAGLRGSAPAWTRPLP